MLKPNLKNILRLAYICLFLFILGFITLIPSTSSSTLAQSNWTTYEDNDPLVLPGYSAGDWQTVSVPEAVGGNLTWTDVPSAKLVLYFEGSAIEILYSRGPEGGDFHISLDGMTWPQFNSYVEQYLYGTSIQQFNLAPRVHQLVITNDDGALWIEAIRVYGSLFDTSVEWGLLIEDNFDDGNFSYWMSDGQLDYMLVEHDLGQAVSFASGQMMRLETGGYRNMVLVASVLVEQGVAEFSIRASENGHYYLQFFSDGTLSFYRNETFSEQRVSCLHLILGMKSDWKPLKICSQFL